MLHVTVYDGALKSEVLGKAFPMFRCLIFCSCDHKTTDPDEALADRQGEADGGGIEMRRRDSDEKSINRSEKLR